MSYHKILFIDILIFLFAHLIVRELDEDSKLSRVMAAVWLLSICVGVPIAIRLIWRALP